MRREELYPVTELPPDLANFTPEVDATPSTFAPAATSGCCPKVWYTQCGETAGCDRCKIRRKKCDETKPKCKNCCRMNLACVWGTARAKVHTNKDLVPLGSDVPRHWPTSGEIKRVPPLIRDGGDIRKHIGQGYQQFRDQTQFDLTVWSLTAMQGLVSQSADPEFKDLSALMTIAVTNDWLRDALVAFSAYSLLTIGKGDAKWERIGMVAYQRALAAIRSHIYASGERVHSLETLVAITFLGLSESLGTGNAVGAITHFSAAALICKTVPFASMDTPTERRLYYIAVECWLYNLAILSLFHEDCESIVRCVDWGVLDACFQSSLSTTGWSLHVSPFLGGNHGIYKLMLQITWLARKKSPLLTRQARALAWLAELDDLEPQLSRYYSVLPEQVAGLYHTKALLHIHALRIFSEKVADHDLTSASPIILFHLQKAQQVFLSQPTHESRNPALAWPLIIFLCAAEEEPIFDFFVRIVHDIHDNFDVGHTRRILAVLATIWCQRARGGDGLDLLLRKRGFFAAD